MTRKEFAQLQSVADSIGLITAIVKTGRHKNKSVRYEVVINGEVKKKYKRRVSAKSYIEKAYNQKLTQQN